MRSNRQRLLKSVLFGALLSCASSSLLPVWALEPNQSGVMGEGALAQELITSITPHQLRQLLTNEGYSVSVDQNGKLVWKIDGRRVLLIIQEDGKSIQFYSAFGGGVGSLRKVNDWNRTKRFSRSYIDQEGDPVLEADLDLVGGISKRRLIDFVRTCRLSFDTWYVEVVK